MYLHARPNDSSSRFLAITSRNHLQVFGPGVTNGLAASAVQGELTLMNPEVETKRRTTKKKATVRAQARNVAPPKGKAKKNATLAPEAPKPRTGAKDSKTSQILELLKRPDGATLSELMNASGWQAHSVRGFLSGTIRKKMKLTLTSNKLENWERSYSIARSEAGARVIRRAKSRFPKPLED
jgi:hypothetical protein